MKFCENCNNILVVKATDHGKIFFCRNCNKEYPLTEEVSFGTSHGEGKVAKIVSEETSEFAITKILCPQCDKQVDAEWAMQQTRGGDEPPTRFYRCKTCGHVWREYS